MPVEGRDHRGRNVRRMTETEFVMWTLDADPALRSDFVNVTMLASAPDEGRLRAKIGDALRDVPHFADRVVTAPLRLAPPEWHPEHQLDLDYHLRKLAVPSPGGMRELLDLAAIISATPFDRTRPLWEFTLVEGLRDGRVALIEKVHHAVTDGVGALELSMSMVDLEPDPPGRFDGRPSRPVRRALEDPLERTTVVDVVTDALGFVLRRQVGLARRAIAATADALIHPQDARARANDAAALLASVRRQVLVTDPARSPLFAERSLSRRFETFTVPFEPAKKAAKALGGTLNDLYVTGVAGALGLYHQRLGAPVEELRMAMPVNVRSRGDTDPGNAFVPTRMLVPVGPKDPAERFAQVQSRIASLRHEPALGAVGPLSGMMAALPPPVLVALARVQAATIDFATSNLRGSPVDLYTGGAHIEANYAMGPREGSPLNITMLSYCNELQMGLHLDPAAITDPGALLESMHESFDALLLAGV
jgi:WS/DGAT/MGAT family acyltransferase